jgi:RNA polymerase-binding transcription factor DksA
VSDAVDDQTEPDQTDPSGETPPADASPMAAAPIDDHPVELGEIDVVGIEADLDGVQTALTRLADGVYWTDEVTGEPIPADVLAANPLARRA